MKRKIIYDKIKDIRCIKDFEGMKLEINQRHFIDLQGRVNKLNKQSYNSKNISYSSFNRFEFNTGLDAKLKHRKKREGD